MLYGRIQGDQSVGGDEERAAVHVGHEKLSPETRWKGIPKSCGKRAKPGTILYYCTYLYGFLSSLSFGLCVLFTWIRQLHTGHIVYLKLSLKSHSYPLRLNL